MQTSFQRALEAAEARADARRAESWRFWAGYEHASVGACQSSTEAVALARVEATAKARWWQPLERVTPITQIGMVDIIAAWRVACAEHDATIGERKKTDSTGAVPTKAAVGWVDRVVQWG